MDISGDFIASVLFTPSNSCVTNSTATCLNNHNIITNHSSNNSSSSSSSSSSDNTHNNGHHRNSHCTNNEFNNRNNGGRNKSDNGRNKVSSTASGSSSSKDIGGCPVNNGVSSSATTVSITSSSRHNQNPSVSMLNDPSSDEIHQLHMLGLHLDHFENVVRLENPASGTVNGTLLSPQAESNDGNQFSYPNGCSDFGSIIASGGGSAEMHHFDPTCGVPNFDQKSQISWSSPDNTDGAIYSFEIVNDHVTQSPSPFWDEDNLSPLPPMKHQHSPFDANHLSASTVGETISTNNMLVVTKTAMTSSNEDYDSTNLLLRNALLGKCAAPRYSEKQLDIDDALRPGQTVFLSAEDIKRENQNSLPLPPMPISSSNHMNDSGQLDDSQSLNLFPGSDSSLSSALSPQQMDEIFLPGFDSFPSYLDNELSMNVSPDFVQTIQQMCNAEDNFVSYMPPQQMPDLDQSSVQQMDVDIPCQSMMSTTPAKPSSRKHYRKSQKNKMAAAMNHHSDMNHDNNNDVNANNNNLNSADAVSQSSLGARKERSLHHCYVCNKGFKDKYSVNVHIRTHTGEKPFSCMVCGKRFRQKAHLAKHQHTHFQKKPLPSSTTLLPPPPPLELIKISDSSLIKIEPR